MVKPRSAIAVVDASQCIQAFDVYYDDDIVYVVLTAKGMIQYVKFDYPTFSILFTDQIVEGVKSNAVFSAIACPDIRKPQVAVVVAGFDVDRRANMMIVLDAKGDRLSKLDAVSNDDRLPIVEMRARHDAKLKVTHVISRSIRSVYVHCLDAKHRLTPIFDRLMDGMLVNGVIYKYADGVDITLTVNEALKAISCD